LSNRVARQRSFCCTVIDALSAVRGLSLSTVSPLVRLSLSTVSPLVRQAAADG
jgi:hypothetical protein